MAVIGKIRSYSGLLIAIIGLGLAAFVLQDFFGSRPQQRGIMEIGKVGKNKISYIEFDRRLSEELDMYKRRRGVESLEMHEEFMVRQQTWERIINEYLLEEEIENLGIRVSSEELRELFFGENPHSLVVGAFNPDPTTGRVDLDQMVQILQSLDPYDSRLIRLENEVRKQRAHDKYYNIIKKSYYVPEKLAELYYISDNTTADFQYILKRYNQVPDTAVVISDNDLIAAYEEIKHMHEQEETRDIEYVVLPVYASDEDRQKIYNDVLSLKEELINTSKANVESFVNAVSDWRFNSEFKSPGSLAPEIDSLMFNAPERSIYGPYLRDNAFVVSMLHNIELRPDSMSAAHILISYMGAFQADEQVTRTYQQAKEKADSLLEVLKRGRAVLSNIAAEVSDDPSATFNQGDLGWFQDGQMVQGFNQAIIDNPVGSFVIAETEFGFHVINITGKSRMTRKVQVAEVAREIVPSSITYQMVYAQSSDFAVQLRKTRNFSEMAEEHGLVKREAPRLKEMDNNIPGVLNPREIIRWAFTEDIKVGAVSRIFEIEDRFIIAHLTRIRQAGIPTMEDIESHVRTHALNQKKYEYISEKISKLQFNDLEALAEQLETEVKDVSGIKRRASIISGVGREPYVIGKLFTFDLFSISDPIKGNNGVIVVELLGMYDAITPENLSSTRNNMERTFTNRVNRLVVDALMKNAKIEDHRSWFY